MSESGQQGVRFRGSQGGRAGPITGLRQRLRSHRAARAAIFDSRTDEERGKPRPCYLTIGAIASGHAVSWPHAVDETLAVAYGSVEARPRTVSRELLIDSSAVKVP